MKRVLSREQLLSSEIELQILHTNYAHKHMYKVK